MSRTKESKKRGRGEKDGDESSPTEEDPSEEVGLPSAGSILRNRRMARKARLTRIPPPYTWVTRAGWEFPRKCRDSEGDLACRPYPCDSRVSKSMEGGEPMEHTQSWRKHSRLFKSSWGLLLGGQSHQHDNLWIMGRTVCGVQCCSLTRGVLLCERTSEDDASGN